MISAAFNNASGSKKHFASLNSVDRSYGITSLPSDSIENVINNQFQEDYLKARIHHQQNILQRRILDRIKRKRLPQNTKSYQLYTDHLRKLKQADSDSQMRELSAQQSSKQLPDVRVKPRVNTQERRHRKQLFTLIKSNSK